MEKKLFEKKKMYEKLILIINEPSFKKSFLYKFSFSD